MEHFGIKKTKLHELLYWGRRMKGPHPLLGGLWPVFRVSHKCTRITQTAIDRHLRHMDRLEDDPMYAAQQKAKARPLEGVRYGVAA